MCFKINGILETVVSGYLPVTFDDRHFSIANMVINSVVFDYRFRTTSLDDISLNDSSTESIIKIITIGPQKKIMTLDKARTKDITEFFFGDSERKIKTKIDSSEIDEVYDEYISFLLGMQEKLLSKYNDLMQKLNKKKESSKQDASLNSNKSRQGNDNKENQPEKFSIEDILKLEIKKKGLKLSERTKSRNPTEITKELTKEINEIAGVTLQIWNKYLDLVKGNSNQVLKNSQEDYERMLNETFGYFIFPNVISKSLNYAELHRIQSEKLRASKFFETLKALFVSIIFNLFF